MCNNNWAKCSNNNRRYHPANILLVDPLCWVEVHMVAHIVVVACLQVVMLWFLVRKLPPVDQVVVYIHWFEHRIDCIRCYYIEEHHHTFLYISELQILVILYLELQWE